jgi:hypothetical protein
MKLAVFAALAAAAACRGNPIREIAAPAPAGALECSRRVLAELGYAVDGGNAAGGFLYLQRPPDSLVATLVTAEERRGELRLSVSTRTDRNRHAPPTEEALRHARSVISTCALSPDTADAAARRDAGGRPWRIRPARQADFRRTSAYPHFTSL